MARYKKLDRVRVNTGRERGHYGTIRDVGESLGDFAHCPYYAVKLDCNPDVLGYSENELDDANWLDWRAMAEPLERMTSEQELNWRSMLDRIESTLNENADCYYDMEQLTAIIHEYAQQRYNEGYQDGQSSIPSPGEST